MRAIFLHVLADAMGSVAVIASTLAVQYLHWHWADPLASVTIAVSFSFPFLSLHFVSNMLADCHVWLKTVPDVFDSAAQSALSPTLISAGAHRGGGVAVGATVCADSAGAADSAACAVVRRCQPGLWPQMRTRR